MKKVRTLKDKLNTLFFGKDLRVTTGDVYTEIRKGDFSEYCPIEKYISEQKLPKNAYDIRDFGADVSKSDKENTLAIQTAIDECFSQGGTTVLISGGSFTVNTLYLRSGITLFIEKGSSLCANKTGIGYRHNAMLYAKECENITLTGGGKIIGNGTFFGRKPVKENNFTPSEIIDVIEMRRDYRAQLRFAHESKYGSILLTDKCKNVLIDSIVFEDSPWWTYKMLNCDGVKIKNSVVNNNRNTANADGFDIAGSSNVEISHCFVSTADDAIVLKNATWCGCEGEMHTIHIKDCELMSRTNAFKIGTETTYDIHDVKVESCTLFMTDLYPGAVSGISIEACDGAKVYDIEIKNIKMNRCTCPLFIRLGNRNRAAKVTAATSNKTEIRRDVSDSKPNKKNEFNAKSELYNIRVENITATDIELPVIISGYRQGFRKKYCTDILLKNFDLGYRQATEIVDRRLFIPEYAREYPECWRFRNLPSYAIWARHCKNLNIENFNCKGIEGTHRKARIFKDCK